LGFPKKPKKNRRIIMAQEFRSDSIPPGSANAESPDEGRESVRIVIAGSREGIREQIQIFYNKGIAQVDAWSRLLPGAHLGEFMTIMTRWRKRTR
jgi:hypothetical protein